MAFFSQEIINETRKQEIINKINKYNESQREIEERVDGHIKKIMILCNNASKKGISTIMFPCQIYVKETITSVEEILGFKDVSISYDGCDCHDGCDYCLSSNYKPPVKGIHIRW